VNAFLPYSDFAKSAQCLDRLRLNKQIIEAHTILKINSSGDSKQAWYNHPCTIMWRGYETALMSYHNEMLREWSNRGYRHSYIPYPITDDVIMPPFIGDTDFHVAMQSNLVRKNPEHYRKYFPEAVDTLPYIWGTGGGND